MQGQEPRVRFPFQKQGGQQKARSWEVAPLLRLLSRQRQQQQPCSQQYAGKRSKERRVALRQMKHQLQRPKEVAAQAGRRMQTADQLPEDLCPAQC